jgi:hypothetical protein
MFPIAESAIAFDATSERESESAKCVFTYPAREGFAAVDLLSIIVILVERIAIRAFPHGLAAFTK